MKQFNLYDLIAIVAPGAVLVIGLANIVPGIAHLLGSKELSVGEFGVMLIASYVAGNLLGPISHLVESSWFTLRGGNHTDRVQSKDTKVLHRAEVEALNERLRANSMLRAGEDLRGISRAQWRAVARQIRAFIAVRGQAERIEVFNAHYGLNRGLAAAFAVLLVAIALTMGVPAWRAMAGLGVGVVLAVYRMNDFGRHYATELMRQFLHFTDKQETPNNTDKEGD